MSSFGAMGVVGAGSGAPGSEGEFCATWGRSGLFRRRRTRIGTKMIRQRTASTMETISIMVWSPAGASVKAQSPVGREPAEREERERERKGD